MKGISIRDKGYEIRDGTKITGSHWKNLTGKKQIILVDFDHTITKKCLGCPDGLNGDSVQVGAREALQELSKDYQIWIFTGNYNYLDSSIPVNRTKAAIKKFLRENGIPFDKVLQTKPPAAFIIDDRAVYHTSWERSLNQIAEREQKR